MNADSTKPNLLKNGVKIRNITPAVGSEVTGLDLRQLTDAQKDELALLVAERGVVCKPSPHLKSFSQKPNISVSLAQAGSIYP